MNILKLKRTTYLFITLAVLGTSITSCEKDFVIVDDVQGIKTDNVEDVSDNNLSSLLAKYPNKVTIDNWEEFVYAPKEVIDHFSKLENENQLLLSKQTQSPENAEVKSRKNEIGGAVRIFSTGTWRNIADVNISFSGSCDFMTETDNSDGDNYCFPANCNNAIATMSSNINPLNGVSTLDLVLITRHILGLQIFLEARQYLAADVNRDGLINGTDIIRQRQVILGNVANFPENDIVFVPDFLYNMVQEEVNNTTTGTINTFLLENAGEDFSYGVNSAIKRNRRAIKTGDVNGSYGLN